MRGAEFRADVFGRFADDLDDLGQREPEQLVVVQVCALLVPAVRDRFRRRIDKMSEAHPVLRPLREVEPSRRLGRGSSD